MNIISTHDTYDIEECARRTANNATFTYAPITPLDYRSMMQGVALQTKAERAYVAYVINRANAGYRFDDPDVAREAYIRAYITCYNSIYERRKAKALKGEQ